MKKLPVILFLICSSLFAGQINFVQQASINDMQNKTIRHILELQDKRNVEGILQYLQHPNDVIAKQAITSLASIGKTDFVSSLLPIFQSENLELKKSAGLTLGLLGIDSLSSSILQAELLTANNSSYKAILFEAFGRTGTDDHLDSLLLIPTSNDEEELGKIWGIVRFALNGIKNSNSISYLFEQFNSANEEIKLNATLALFRSTTLSSVQGDDIEKIIFYANRFGGFSKLYLINALGILQTRDDIKEILLNSLADELPVRLSVLRILEKYPLNKEEVTKILDISSNDEHFNLAKYRFLYRMRLVDSSDIQYISERIDNFLKSDNLSWREKAELLTGVAIMNGDNAIPVLLKEAITKNDKYNAKIIRALGEIKTMKAANTVLYQVKPNDATNSWMAQLEAISKLRTFVIKSQVDKLQTRSIFLKALKSNNVPVMTAVINAVSNEELVAILPIDDLISAYKTLKYPDDFETMIEFINLFAFYFDPKTVVILEEIIEAPDNKLADAALNSLQYVSPDIRYLRNPSSDTMPLNTFYDWEYFEDLCANQTFELITEKGKITLLFFPHEAPFTSISIAKLIDEKFFDGLDFHRVISNFVIQGGDPTGTGYGSPGYTIRTEVSHLKFETGYVGMASAGKDTEGSQFFITHSPQPHLDGRYTVFAKVIEGMEVVNKIQEGDKIISFSRVK